MSSQMNDSHAFTEHPLDSIENSLLRNASTKSVILAPFNSTITDGNDDLEEYKMLEGVDVFKNKAKVVKFGIRVKDIDRQYEQNNNQDLDNGVFNNFVNQSESNGNEDSKHQTEDSK